MICAAAKCPSRWRPITRTTAGSGGFWRRRSRMRRSTGRTGRTRTDTPGSRPDSIPILILSSGSLIYYTRRSSSTTRTPGWCAWTYSGCWRATRSEIPMSKTHSGGRQTNENDTARINLYLGFFHRPKRAFFIFARNRPVLLFGLSRNQCVFKNEPSFI